MKKVNSLKVALYDFSISQMKCMRLISIFVLDFVSDFSDKRVPRAPAKITTFILYDYLFRFKTQ
jgi:hypothetical protein